MKSASVTQAKDTKESQRQKFIQAFNENDFDVALNTSFNTKSSKSINERSKMKKKREMKRAV